MKWLVTFSPLYKQPEVYLRWVGGGGIEGIAHRTGDARPGSPREFDALLLSGGGDVSPTLYGATPAPETGGVDLRRDAREIELIQGFLASGRPVFGICRGIQILNVALGGRLVQHVPHWLDARGAAGEAHAAEGADARHGLCLTPESALGRALAGAAETNSMHHQAVDPRAVAPGWRVSARSPQGVIEACEATTAPAPVQAVQWHPERLPPEHPASRLLILHWRDLTARARLDGGGEC